jgi:hypothetical protein
MTTSQQPQKASNPKDSSPQALPGDFVVRASIAVLAGTLLLRLAGGLALSSLGLYLNSLGAQGAGIAWVAAGYYATELLLAPVFGALSDRYGRKIFLVLAPLLGAVALVLYPHASTVTILFAIRVLEGVSAGGAIPATLGYLSDLTDGSKYRSRIMGLFEVMTLVGVCAWCARLRVVLATDWFARTTPPHLVRLRSSLVQPPDFAFHARLVRRDRRDRVVVGSRAIAVVSGQTGLPGHTRSRSEFGRLTRWSRYFTRPRVVRGGIPGRTLLRLETERWS